MDTTRLLKHIGDISNTPLHIQYVSVGMLVAETIAYNIALQRLVGQTELIKHINARMLRSIEWQKANIPTFLLETGCDELDDPSLYETRPKLGVNNFKLSTVLNNEVATVHKAVENLVFTDSDEPIDESNVVLDLINWLKDNSKRTDVDATVALVDYGLDSLLGYELICFVSDQYQVEIDLHELDQTVSIESLARRIIS